MSSEDASSSLDEDSIDLWYCRDQEIVDKALLARCYLQLSDAEAQQQRRFYFEGHRHQYLITRTMVRCILSLYQHHVSPEQWTFSTNTYGKPYISGPIAQPLRFNLSHTTGLVVLAVAKQREIGVDVEFGMRDTKWEQLVDRFFSPAEIESFHSLSRDQQRCRFYELWTLKESYIKARGMGLSLPLDGFSFQFPATNDIEIAFTPKIVDDAERWKFWLLKPGEEHTVAVAVKGNSAEEQFHICIREFAPPGTHTVVQWPCLRSSSGLRDSQSPLMSVAGRC